MKTIGQNFILILAFMSTTSYGEPLAESAQLTQSFIQASAQFGRSIATNGQLVAIGAPSSDSATPAFLYDANTLQLLHELNPNDPNSTSFGESIAVSTQFTLVGCPLQDEIASRSGAAYVFDSMNGHLLFKLAPSDLSENSEFGKSVAIYNDLLFVGAPRRWLWQQGNGAVYVFNAETGLQIDKIVLPPNIEDTFGMDLEVDGDTLYISAFSELNSTLLTRGNIYTYDLTTMSLSFLQGIDDNDCFPDDKFCGATLAFGETLAVNEGVILGDSWIPGTNGFINKQIYLVRSPSDLIRLPESGTALDLNSKFALTGYTDNQSPNFPGEARLFDLSSNSEVWELLPSDGGEYDLFGHSGVMNGNRILIGAPQHGNNGAVYVFNLPCSADLTGDGYFNFFDISAFLSAFAVEDPIADFSDDGEFNFFDVSAFLSAFAAGCS